MGELQKFSSEADPDLLRELHDIATREGREFHAVLGDALRAYAARKREGLPRRAMLQAFEASLQERDILYRALAK